MSDYKISIVGYGYVGTAYHKAFPEAYIYDEPKGIGSREEVNKCDLAIVCVPTPMKEDGTCDTSIVESVIEWLGTPLILIKSAIVPGTTDRLKEKYKKRICVSPEFVGEGKYWIPPWEYPDPLDPTSHGFQIIGGDEEDADAIAGIMVTKLGPSTKFHICTALESEFIKYMENSWGAMKVSFVQEFYGLCQKLGVNWNRVREGWLLDPRVERMHTAVFPNKRKWGGKCWPKDVMGIIKFAESKGYEMKLMKRIVQNNFDMSDE